MIAKKVWEKDSNSRRMALTLLQLHANKPIPSELFTYTDSYQAFQFLSREYRLSNHQTALTLYNKVASLNLEDCKNIDDFNELLDNVLYLRYIGEQVSDVFVHFKVFSSLTPDFDNCSEDENHV
ncbi:hypothetical protein BDV06DRAFT_199084 [Aspergillus oleicola]